MQQYLHDFVNAVVESHAEQFRSGSVVPEDIQIRESAKCIAYSDVADLELETIFEFYKEEDNADETARQPASTV